MNDESSVPRVLVLCTVSTGLDAIAEVIREGIALKAIVGLDPEVAKPQVVSGFVDIKRFATKWNIPCHYVRRYDLKDETDRKLLKSLDFDLLWVSGWQRLIPEWLIAQATIGAFGGHGSPDGINGGRGRSPQNWAIMLGCQRFDLALFKISSGIDDGPIVAQRSFFYNETDDISISYKKSALCMSEMVKDVINNPSLLLNGVKQLEKAFYYPQRKPEDGYVDWNLSQREIWAFCRALTRPYPGMRTKHNDSEIIIWECLPFDDRVSNSPGIIDFVFEDKNFLVSCRDGRVLVRDYSCLENWTPKPNFSFHSKSIIETIKFIEERHYAKYPDLEISKRIKRAF